MLVGEATGDPSVVGARAAGELPASINTWTYGGVAEVLHASCARSVIRRIARSG